MSSSGKIIGSLNQLRTNIVVFYGTSDQMKYLLSHYQCLLTSVLKLLIHFIECPKWKDKYFLLYFNNLSRNAMQYEVVNSGRTAGECGRDLRKNRNKRD